jgi:CBS domain containing-hemolysin-like protein
LNDVVLWLVLLALLCASALLSGCETALFSLTPAERRRLGGDAERLLSDPRGALISILFVNLVINVLFFTFFARLSPGGNALVDLLWGLGAVAVLVTFAEIVPKIVALRIRMAVARRSAFPLLLIVRSLRPLRRALEWILELIYRALGPASHPEAGVTNEALAQALERSADRGVLLGSEAEFLTGVVELQGVRVREIMTPRVDMVFLDRNSDNSAEVIARALEAKLPWIVVIDGDPDHIVGRVRLREVLVQPPRPLAELMAPVYFFPEIASALDALTFLREKHLMQAVVVDEWGGTAGLVTIEDVFEAIVGDLRVEGEREEHAVNALPDGGFRVAGWLSIRDWNELFGHRVVATEFETVAGLVTVLLGKIPRAGDEARHGPFLFRVHSVRGRRIDLLDIFLQPSAEAQESQP